MELSQSLCGKFVNITTYAPKRSSNGSTVGVPCGVFLRLLGEYEVNKMRFEDTLTDFGEKT